MGAIDSEKRGVSNDIQEIQQKSETDSENSSKTFVSSDDYKKCMKNVHTKLFKTFIQFCMIGAFFL